MDAILWQSAHGGKRLWFYKQTLLINKYKCDWCRNKYLIKYEQKAIDVRAQREGYFCHKL